MTEPHDLIQCLLAASGPSIELDEAIRIAVGADTINLGAGEGLMSDESCYGPPEYTSSIDVALTLVPADWRVNWAGEVPGGGWFFELIARYTNDATDRVWAASGPLALCIVALKARATKDKLEGKD